MSPLAHVLKGLVLAYRYSLSALIGNECRFKPTCSEYASDAITAHGAIRGGWLAIRRVARCHPWGGSGWDPVPPADDPPSDPDAAGPTRSRPHSY